MLDRLNEYVRQAERYGGSWVIAEVIEEGQARWQKRKSTRRRKRGCRRGGKRTETASLPAVYQGLIRNMDL